MKPELSFLTVAVFAAVSFAQPSPQPSLPSGANILKRPVHVMSPSAQSNMLAKVGGLAQQVVAGPSLLFLNTQTRVKAASLDSTTEQIQKILRLPTTFRSQPSSEPVAAALTALADTNTAAVVVIADVEGYPALLVAPESSWALVNVAALGGASLPSAQLTERTQKEVWRAFAYLMGAANSSYEHCLMKSVRCPADLDALKPKTLCPEPFGKIVEHAQKMGVHLTRTTSYKKAVEEGWAPAPTNDVQRAIWKEFGKVQAK